MTGDTRAQPGAGFPDPRDDEIARLLGQYIDRLSAGEKLDRARIEAEHPLHAAELLRELETFLDLAGEHGPRQPIEIGGYRTVRVAGRGGMGVVYEAWDPAMDRQVAVKVLPAEMASDPKAIARFLKEAKIAARLQHPNIVAIHSMGVSGGAPYYVMEMVEGHTLAQTLREDGLASRADLAYFARTAEAFAGAADGLTHAHAKGVVHRDLKPSNLIVDASGHLRILDFGLASLEGLSGITGSQSILGTPLYMSPEAARGGARTLDARSDIYSLGASLYEAVAFEPPFQGKDASDTLARIIAGDPRPPRHKNPRVPLDLETIVLKCLEKDPARRYETASELAADLRRFARGEAIRARPRGPFARTARIVWRRRAAVGAAAAVILLASLTALVVAQRRREQAAALDRSYEQKTLEAMMMLEAAAPHRGGRPRLVTVGALSPHERREAADDARSGLLGGVALALEPELEEARPDPLREALRLLGEGVELCPARPEARYHRARALHAAGRRDEALDAVRPLVDGEVPFAPARVWKAVHLEKAAAGEALATGAQNGGWEAAYLLAAEARAKGRWKEAAAAGSRLLQVLARGADPYLGAKLEAHLARGRAWLELKEPDEALADFAAAQALAPEAVDPVLLMARTFLQKGMPEAADARLKDLYDATRFKSEAADRSSTLLFDFKSYSRALEWAELMDPSPRRESSRAYCLARLGDPDKALAAARGGVALDERDPLAHYCLGWVLERSHRYDEAADSFRAAIALDSVDARFHLGLGRALGRWAYEGGRPEEAHAAFAQALAIDPASLLAMNGLAWMSRALEREEEAKIWFQKAIAHEPKDVAALNGLGFLLAVEMRYDDAIEAFERVLAVDPEIAVVHSNLGWMHWRKHDCDKAAAACARAIELDPEFEKPHVILGCCYLEQGKLEAALAEFEVMAKKNPANGFAHFKQAVTLERLRRPEDAIEAYRRAIGVNRHDVRYFFNLGNLLRDLGRFDVAIDEYRNALQVEPDHDLTHNNLGLALFQAGRPEEAAAHFAAAIRIAPRSPDAYFNLATVLASEGKLDEAIARLSAGLPHAPRDPRPLRQLATWKAGQGDFAGAIAACERGVEIVDALLAERPQSRSLRGELLASLDLLSEGALKAGNEAKARASLSRALSLRKEAASRSDASVEALNDCAWSLLECGIEELREPATALAIARRAAAMTEEKDAAILDTLALALFRTGDSPAAVAAQRRAVALLPEAAPDTPEGSVRAEMEARLRQFEAAGKERP